MSLMMEEITQTKSSKHPQTCDCYSKAIFISKRIESYSFLTEKQRQGKHCFGKEPLERIP